MKNLLESGPKHCIGSPPSARSVLVRSDHGSVDDGTNLIMFELELLEDKLPDTPVCPVGEAIVDRLPRAEALREIAPWNAGFRAEKDRVDELSVADLRFGTLTTLRKKGSQPGPLLITQCMSVHRKLGSHSRSRHKLSAIIRDSP